MAALFAAGAAGAVQDEGHKNYAGAECWELLNMRNVSDICSLIRVQTTLAGMLSRLQSQFQFGDWPHVPHVTPIHTGGQVVHSI